MCIPGFEFCLRTKISEKLGATHSCITIFNVFNTVETECIRSIFLSKFVVFVFIFRL